MSAIISITHSSQIAEYDIHAVFKQKLGGHYLTNQVALPILEEISKEAAKVADSHNRLGNIGLIAMVITIIPSVAIYRSNAERVLLGVAVCALLVLLYREIAHQEKYGYQAGAYLNLKSRAENVIYQLQQNPAATIELTA